MKNAVFALFLLLCAPELFAQAQGVTCYNNPLTGNPEFRRLAPTSDGGYIAHSNPGPANKAVKINSSFTVDWSYEVTNLFFKDNVETKDGNYVFLATDISPNGVHVFKFTPGGTLLWQKVYTTAGGFLNVMGIAPAAGTDNGFVFYGGVSAVVMHYMVKCDAGGNVEWSNQYGGIPGAGAIYSVIPEQNGYVAAASYGWNQVSRVAVLRIDNTGNVTAARNYESNTSSTGISVYPSSLVSLTNGNYFLWTYPQQISTAINFTLSSSLGVVSCNMLSDSTGIIVDAVPTNNPGNDVMMLFSYYHNADGGFLTVSPSTGAITAQKYAPGGGIIPHEGIRLANAHTVIGGYVGAQNQYGSMLCLTDDAGNGMCNAVDASFTAQPNYPYTSSALNATTSQFNLVYVTDTFALDTTVYTSVNICGYLTNAEPAPEAAVLIACFPNPAQGVIIVQLPSTLNLNETTLQLFDANGRCVETRSSLQSNLVELRPEAAGVYFVLLSGPSGNVIGSARFVNAGD